MEAITINSDGSVAVLDFNAIPEAAWQQIYEFMSNTGFDWPDATFAKAAFQRLFQRGYGTESNPFKSEHAEALKRALGTGKDIPKPSRPKTISPQNIQKAIKTFGLTDDFRLAGYILPNGQMLDFSGGSGSRAYDHRNIGMAFGESGTKGMMDFMISGAIRIMPSNVDLAKTPTDAQLRIIADMARQQRGEISVTLRDGVKWDPSREMSYGGRKFDKNYDIGTNPAYILEDIRKFYSKSAMAEWAKKNCRFANMENEQEDDPESIPPLRPIGPRATKKIVQYPFSKVKRDSKEGWYLDWGNLPGNIITLSGISQDITDVQEGDLVGDTALNFTPYWRAAWVDSSIGRIYVDPIEPNPFLAQVGAGGKPLDEHDWDVHSGDYEKKKVNDVLDTIQNGKHSSPRDVAYLLKGTVPVNFGPNGAQGGWYNAPDTHSNRGGHQGLDPSQIMVNDAKALKKLGYDIPPKALDGTMDPYTWTDWVNGSQDINDRRAEETLMNGENWKDPQTAAMFVLNHQQPQIKFRNFQALQQMFDPYPRKQVNDLWEAGKEEEGKRLDESYRRGELRNNEMEPMLHDLAKQILTLEHPSQKRNKFDPYYLLKEKVIQLAEKMNWPDILELYEGAYDSDNRRWVADAYTKKGEVNNLLRMEQRENNIEVLRALIYDLSKLNYSGLSNLVKSPKYQKAIAGDDYYAKELRNTINIIISQEHHRQAEWVRVNCKFSSR